MPGVELALLAFAGAAAGVAFFAALGWTVARLDGAAHPALLMFTSLAMRFGLLLAGVYAVAVSGGWPHLLAAVAGFTLARFAMLRRGLPRLAAGSDR